MAVQKRKTAARKKAGAVKKKPAAVSSDQRQVMQVLHSEHTYLARLQQALELQIQQIRPGQDTAYPVLRDMMKYLVEYPDIYHHPLEDKIFQRLLKLPNYNARYVNELLSQHDDMARESRYLLSELEQICEGDARLDRVQLKNHLREYLEFYRQHIGLEESRVFPDAEQYLSAEDWAEIKGGMSQYHDPIFSDKPDKAYAGLAESINASMQAAVDEVVLFELLSAEAILESGQVLYDGVSEVSELLSDVVKQSWADNKSSLWRAIQSEGSSELLYLPLHITVNNVVNSTAAVSDLLQLGKEIGHCAIEPFSSRLLLRRQMQSRASAKPSAKNKTKRSVASSD